MQIVKTYSIGEDTVIFMRADSGKLLYFAIDFLSHKQGIFIKQAYFHQGIRMAGKGKRADETQYN